MEFNANRKAIPLEHVRLPDLIAVFGLELFVGRRSEQLAFRKAALLEEVVEGGADSKS